MSGRTKDLMTLNPHWSGNTLVFDCPECHTHSIRVGPPVFTIKGSNFTNITITPSIDTGCWHGFVHNGNTVDA